MLEGVFFGLFVDGTFSEETKGLLWETGRSTAFSATVSDFVPTGFDSLTAATGTTCSATGFSSTGAMLFGFAGTKSTVSSSMRGSFFCALELFCAAATCSSTTVFFLSFDFSGFVSFAASVVSSTATGIFFADPVAGVFLTGTSLTFSAVFAVFGVGTRSSLAV